MPAASSSRPTRNRCLRGSVQPRRIGLCCLLLRRLHRQDGGLEAEMPDDPKERQCRRVRVILAGRKSWDKVIIVFGEFELVPGIFVGTRMKLFREANPSFANDFGEVGTVVGGSRRCVDVRLLLQCG